jgi:sensor histidine kinase regulating citrate/malate metabolism
MTEDQLNKLYTKDEKMNQEKSGQGIGLFMVKKIVDHFFGTIDVESKLNEGTTFQVYGTPRHIRGYKNTIKNPVPQIVRSWISFG